MENLLFGLVLGFVASGLFVVTLSYARAGNLARAWWGLTVAGRAQQDPAIEAKVNAVLGGQTVPLASFYAGDTGSRGGARVAVKDLDGDAKADVVVGAGEAAGSRVTGYLGANLAGGAAFGFDAFPGQTAGVFVG